MDQIASNYEENIRWFDEVLGAGRSCDMVCRDLRLAGKRVVIEADEEALAALRGHYPDELLRAADAASYGTEFLSYRMSIRTVGSFDEALEHIARYSSQHSEAIVAEDPETIRRYQRAVDAASHGTEQGTAALLKDVLSY